MRDQGCGLVRGVEKGVICGGGGGGGDLPDDE